MSNLAINTTATASVFVTTYGLANQHGFAYGEWFNLTDYSSKEEFLEDATTYVNGLGDFSPEFCFSDYEASFEVKEFVNESWVSEELWDLLELSSYELNMVTAYISYCGLQGKAVSELMEEAQEHFVGEYASSEDFAYETVQELGCLDNIPDFIACHIDYEGIARDLMIEHFSVNNYYFRSY